MKETTPQDRATEIVTPLVPPDAEERVTRSYKQWNQIVRDHIRSETGLRLSDGDSRFSIPVKVDQGFPVPLAALIDDYPDPVVWRLVIGQPKLGALADGLAFLLRSWDRLEAWPSLPPTARNGRPTLESCLTIALSLQQAAITEQIRQQIQKIHEDILGAYQLRRRTGHASPSTGSQLRWLRPCWT